MNSQQNQCAGQAMGMGNAETNAPTGRQLFQRLVNAGDALNVRIGELERELKMSNDDHSFVVGQYRQLQSQFNALSLERQKLTDELARARIEKGARGGHYEAWIAIMETLGNTAVANGPGTGIENAVGLIRELQRKAALYDAIRTSLDSLR